VLMHRYGILFSASICSPFVARSAMANPESAHAQLQGHGLSNDVLLGHSLIQ